MKRIVSGIILCAIVTTLTSCKKDFIRLMAVRTLSANGITLLVKGQVIDVGEANPEYGFCWSQFPNPTILSNSMYVGKATQPVSYEAVLAGLQSGYTYYIRGYVKDGSNIEYGNQVEMTVSSGTVTLYWDDGEADYGWRYNAGYEGWFGNHIPTTSSGQIIEIELYFNQASGSGSDYLNVDIFNSSLSLIGSTNNFLPGTSTWVTVPGNGISYSGSFYVMVHWDYTVSSTNFLGMDQNGSNAYMDLGFYRDGSGNWGRASSLPTGNMLPGIFLARVTVQTSSGALMTFGPSSIPPGYRPVALPVVRGAAPIR